MSRELLQDLRDEADLCRNETADDVAALLDRAADEIDRLNVIIYANGLAAHEPEESNDGQK